MSSVGDVVSQQVTKQETPLNPILQRRREHLSALASFCVKANLPHEVVKTVVTTPQESQQKN